MVEIIPKFPSSAWRLVVQYVHIRPGEIVGTAKSPYRCLEYRL